MTDMINRCRLILSAGPQICTAETLALALGAGDVACVILRDQDSKPGDFESYCRDVVPLVQGRGCAVLVSSDTQTMGRVEADGLYVEAGHSEVRDFVARFSPHKLVGCGGMMDRHKALVYGEANPDFVMFGKLGKDIRPEPHPKNIELARWWAEFVEVPGVLLGGSDVNSVAVSAQTGCDFVLLEKAIFDGTLEPQEAVANCNALLEAHSPEFEAGA